LIAPHAVTSMNPKRPSAAPPISTSRTLPRRRKLCAGHSLVHELDASAAVFCYVFLQCYDTALFLAVDKARAQFRNARLVQRHVATTGDKRRKRGGKDVARPGALKQGSRASEFAVETCWLDDVALENPVAVSQPLDAGMLEGRGSKSEASVCDSQKLRAREPNVDLYHSVSLPTTISARYRSYCTSQSKHSLAHMLTHS